MSNEPGLRALIITQDEPFFLPRALERLYAQTKGRHQIVGCILLSASPFGKKESFIQKALKTRAVFGNAFFLRYALRFVWNKLTNPNAMEKVLQSHGTPIIRLDQSINAAESLDLIRKHNPDILLSIAGNEIFKRPLIDLAPKGCLNLHTALLPKYRGLMPSFWVLKNREPETGVSIFLVDEGIDSGPIVVQKTVQIGDMTQEQLIRHTKDLGMDGMAEALDIMAQPAPDLIENNADDATYFTFPTAQDVAEFRRAGAKFF